MIIQIVAEIRIKDPTPQLKKWCDENLVIRNPEYDDRMRRGLWTGKTPEYLWLFRVDGQDLVVPTGTGKEIRKFLTEQDLIEIHLADPAHIRIWKDPVYKASELSRRSYGCRSSPSQL